MATKSLQDIVDELQRQSERVPKGSSYVNPVILPEDEQKEEEQDFQFNRDLLDQILGEGGGSTGVQTVSGIGGFSGTGSASGGIFGVPGSTAA